jgi:hypothetical protein
MRLRLLIGGTDYSTSWLQPPDDDWEVERAAYGGIDTFGFTIDDQGSTISLTALANVILEDFADSTTRHFGGKLTEIRQRTLGLGRRFDCKALGWVFDLERATVSDIYRGASDQEIILSTSATVAKPLGVFFNTDKDLTAYTLSTNNIKIGNANTNKIVFNGQTIRSIMELLAGWQGFVWKVDPDQTVHYRAPGDQESTFTLSDAPDNVTAFPYYQFNRIVDASKVVNHVTVFGGTFREENDTQTYSGDGVTTRLLLGLRWRHNDNNADERIEVARNTGTSASPAWENLTVAVPGQSDSTTFAVIWDEFTNTIDFTTAPPNISGPAIRIIGDVWRPLIGEEVDQASIDAVGRFQLTIKDTSLTDDEAVERRADVELRKHASEAEQITVVTNQDGAQPGQLMSISNSVHSIAGNYLIDRMVIRPLSDTFREYELSLRRVPETT